MNQLSPDRMIPLLPCRSIDDQIAFYEALGFEVTYRQKTPNVYAAVQRGAIELHFFVLKGYDPAASYSTCYVHTSDVDRLYAAFREGLMQQLGRVPSRGIPRIGALKDMTYGVRQFLMTDPGGNIIRIGQALTISRGTARPAGSRLERAFAAATLLMYSKGDPETAARVIDAAPADGSESSKLLTLQVRVLRAEAAHALGDDVRAERLLADVAETALTADDRTAAADDLERAAELRLELGLQPMARTDEFSRSRPS